MDRFLSVQAAGWLHTVPQMYPCTALRQEGAARPVFYDGIQGTRVFAWIGVPEGASEKHPVPGMVLIHGGLGGAFSRWVNYWVKRGYAAIAMDTCGAMAMPDDGNPDVPGHWPRHSWSGAPGWGAFDQSDLPPEKQWFTHAASAIMLGHNLLRSMPGVDAERIGVTGVSWGGVLTLISAGIDPRYRAACPVYACGYLGENRNFMKNLKDLPAQSVEWWLREWDPSNFIETTRCPLLWFASTNDRTLFLPHEWQRHTAALEKLSCRTMLLRLNHAHGKCSEEQPEIDAFFDEHLKSGPARPQLSVPECDGGTLRCHCAGPVRGALLTFTADHKNEWAEKIWLELPAAVAPDGTITAELPEHWCSAFITVISPELLRITSGIVFA